MLLVEHNDSNDVICQCRMNRQSFPGTGRVSLGLLPLVHIPVGRLEFFRGPLPLD